MQNGWPPAVRYSVLAPPPGGDPDWRVIDRFARAYFSQDCFAVACFSPHMPDAERHARELCEELNRECPRQAA